MNWPSRPPSSGSRTSRFQVLGAKCLSESHGYRTGGESVTRNLNSLYLFLMLPFYRASSLEPDSWLPLWKQAFGVVTPWGSFPWGTHSQWL